MDDESMVAPCDSLESMDILSSPVANDLTEPVVPASLHPPAAVEPASVTVSIVSHEHEQLIQKLLAQLCTVNGGLIEHVVLTHNLEAVPVAVPPGGWPFRFTEIFNSVPAGFGTNHNRAFARCRTDLFCVLNPDIELCDSLVWSRLAHSASQPGVGCAYPSLLNVDGTPQENAREVVTPFALLRRHLLKNPVQRADWASAAFWLVSARAWRSVGGFDERFYMYCEDVDFCLRLQMAGWKLARAEATAVHDASWSSRQVGTYLGWHLRSLMRLWMQPTLRRYLSWRVHRA